MDGVRVISSVAVFLFVLLASFSAAREERTWGEVAENDLKNYKYLALLEHESVARSTAYCSGTITSMTTVLTYCKGDPSKAYAGFCKLTSGVPDNSTKALQIRNVQKVANYSETLTSLKICKVDNWLLTEYVGAINVNPNRESARADGETCVVLGFVKAKGAQKLTQTIGARSLCEIKGDVLETKTDFLYSKAAAETEKLPTEDQGGPAVCGNNAELRGITVAGESGEKATRETVHCNTYIKIAEYRTWIEEQIKAAEAGESGGAGGTGGTGGNGTASSGYSIHSHLNKYSNWKVLWFLVPPIVAFLQY